MLVQEKTQNYTQSTLNKPYAQTQNSFSKDLEESKKALQAPQETQKSEDKTEVLNAASTLLDKILRALDEKLVDGKTGEKLEFKSLDESMQKDLVSFVKAALQDAQASLEDKEGAQLEILEISISRVELKISSFAAYIGVSSAVEEQKLNVFELLFNEGWDEKRTQSFQKKAQILTQSLEIKQFSYTEYKATSFQSSNLDLEMSFDKLMQDFFNQSSKLEQSLQGFKFEKQSPKKSPLEQFLA